MNGQRSSVVAGVLAFGQFQVAEFQVEQVDGLLLGLDLGLEEEAEFLVFALPHCDLLDQDLSFLCDLVDFHSPYLLDAGDINGLVDYRHPRVQHFFLQQHHFLVHAAIVGKQDLDPCFMFCLQLFYSLGLVFLVAFVGDQTLQGKQLSIVLCLQLLQRAGWSGIFVSSLDCLQSFDGFLFLAELVLELCDPETKVVLCLAVYWIFVNLGVGLKACYRIFEFFQLFLLGEQFNDELLSDLLPLIPLFLLDLVLAVRLLIRPVLLLSFAPCDLHPQLFISGLLCLQLLLHCLQLTLFSLVALFQLLNLAHQFRGSFFQFFDLPVSLCQLAFFAAIFLLDGFEFGPFFFVLVLQVLQALFQLFDLFFFFFEFGLVALASVPFGLSSVFS